MTKPDRISIRVSEADLRDMEREVKRLGLDTISQLMRWVWRKYKDKDKGLLGELSNT